MRDTKKMRELYSIDIDVIENSEELPKPVFINEEFGDLKVVIGGEEFTRNMDKTKKPDILQTQLKMLLVRVFLQEARGILLISLVSTKFFSSRLDFSGRLILNNLKEKKFKNSVTYFNYQKKSKNRKICIKLTYLSKSF